MENDPPEHTHRHVAGQQSRRFARQRMISTRKSGARGTHIRLCGCRDEAIEGSEQADAHGFAVGSRRPARARAHPPCFRTLLPCLRGFEWPRHAVPCPVGIAHAGIPYSAAPGWGVGGKCEHTQGCVHRLFSHRQVGSEFIQGALTPVLTPHSEQVLAHG